MCCTLFTSIDKVCWLYLTMYTCMTYYSVEKDHHDNTVKVRESQDCSQKVLELQKRLEQTRTQVLIIVFCIGIYAYVFEEFIAYFCMS